VKHVHKWAVSAVAAALATAAAYADEQPQGDSPAPRSAAQVDTSLVRPAKKERVPLTFVVTPFVGYRVGGTFRLGGTDTHVDTDNHSSYALALDLSTDSRASQYELFYSRESTSLGAQSPVPSDLVVEYLHIGGTTEFLNPDGRLHPYLIGSVGATRFDPTLAKRTTDFSASIGAGVRADLTQHLAMRLEARGFLTLLSSSTAVFCSSNQNGGLCDIQARGTSFIQADLLAGLSYAF
jgi:opacity protein-like surface antigen